MRKKTIAIIISALMVGLMTGCTSNTNPGTQEAPQEEVVPIETTTVEEVPVEPDSEPAPEIVEEVPTFLDEVLASRDNFKLLTEDAGVFLLNGLEYNAPDLLDYATATDCENFEILSGYEISESVDGNIKTVSMTFSFNLENWSLDYYHFNYTIDAFDKYTGASFTIHPLVLGNPDGISVNDQTIESKDGKMVNIKLSEEMVITNNDTVYFATVNIAMPADYDGLVISWTDLVSGENLEVTGNVTEADWWTNSMKDGRNVTLINL